MNENDNIEYVIEQIIINHKRYFGVHIIGEIDDMYFHVVNKKFSECSKLPFNYLKKQIKLHKGIFAYKILSIDVDDEYGNHYKEFHNGYVFPQKKLAQEFIDTTLIPFFMLQKISNTKIHI